MDEKRKRRSREGSIKTISGYIYARIQWVDEVTGKRKEKLRRASSRTEARKLIKEMVAELENHGAESLNADKLTFASLAEDYSSKRLVEATYSNGIKVSGKRSVSPTKSSLKPLVEFFGHRTLRSIKTSDIEAYKIQRLHAPVVIKTRAGDKERPRKISSVNREIELLRAMFNFAKDDGLIVRSPFESKGKSLIVKGAENERNRILTSDEELRLLEACGARQTTYLRGGKEITKRDSGKSRGHLRALIIVAVDTAARRGELFKLRWKDVDLFDRTITIQASNSKTERARTLGITARSKTELERLWEASPRNENDLVFGIVSTIKNSWKTLCVRAAIQDLNFHDLRHTATTRMIRAGVPHTEVMKITGHSQIKTFLRYLNMTNESILNSANLLDRYIASSQNNTDSLELSNAIN